MEQQLRRAIRKDSFRMVYQPIVELMTRKVVGAEALIRWTDEHGAPVSPDVFIALAEKRGLIREIASSCGTYSMILAKRCLAIHPST
jgi:sensor c-di-GMP phosphodiesterase-like protein